MRVALAALLLLTVADAARAGTVWIPIPIQAAEHMFAAPGEPFPGAAIPEPATLSWSNSVSSGTASASSPAPAGVLTYDFSVTNLASFPLVYPSWTSVLTIQVPDVGTATTPVVFQVTETMAPASDLAGWEVVHGVAASTQLGNFQGRPGRSLMFLDAPDQPLCMQAGTLVSPCLSSQQATSEVLMALPGDQLTFQQIFRQYNPGAIQPGSLATGQSTSASFAFTAFALAPDPDNDGIPSFADNCSTVANPSQLDTDGDQIGNACDCDFSQDGACSIADFNDFLPDFIASHDSGAGTDMDGDGTVGVGDFNLFLTGFLATKPGPSGLVNG